MAGAYKPVHWNPQKYRYDAAFAAILVANLLAFALCAALANPHLSIESLFLRASAFASLVLLHVILAIGPLARLSPRFLPLLYNRRHLGVTLFLLAFAHALLAVIHYHGFGDQNPLVSVFTAYGRDYDPFADPRARASNFPFEPFGALALVILFLMAATSHDFWLRNLGASIWKMLHIGVYFAYGCVLVHVAYGFLQSETHALYPASLGAGFVALVGLHLAAQRGEARIDNQREAAEADGYVKVCSVADLKEGRGKIVRAGGQRLAIFLHQGRVHALSNVCRHQGGPIGEGRIRSDGCVTCPWHGWQYRPQDGASPPPFHEVVPTFRVRIDKNGAIAVDPTPQPLYTVNPGVAIGGDHG
jgi:nitrite reductase/ring-hydroxylating ferredoxin subunit